MEGLKDDMALMQQKAMIDATNTAAGRWNGVLPPLLPGSIVNALTSIFSVTSGPVK